MLDKVLQEAAKEEEKSGDEIAAIFLLGDLCRHGLAVDPGTSPTNWPTMKITMQLAIESIVAAFPKVPILPVIGNNDVEYHDQAPTAEQKTDYYTDLWEIWFESVPANAHIAANDDIRQTFMEGGYYKYDLTDDIIVLGLNGMYPFYENYADKAMSDQMIEWVGDTLTQNKGKKFITLTHVYFGNNFY